MQIECILADKLNYIYCKYNLFVILLNMLGVLDLNMDKLILNQVVCDELNRVLLLEHWMISFYFYINSKFDVYADSVSDDDGDDDDCFETFLLVDYLAVE